MDADTVSLRLSNLEKQVNDIGTKIDKLTEAITQAKLDDKDTSNEIKNHEDRIQKTEEKLAAIETEINTLKEQPTKDKASKWQYIMDFLFKTIVGTGFIAVLSYIGFNLEKIRLG